MKKLIVFTFLIVLGALIGSTLVWVDFHSNKNQNLFSSKNIENILQFSNTNISKENYNCEGDYGRSVGAVFGSIVSFGSMHKVNMLSYGCVNSVCSFSVSNCKPWQNDSCGSRLLVYGIDSIGNIDESSFKCIDMP